MFNATLSRQSALLRAVAEGQTPARFPAPELAPLCLDLRWMFAFPLNWLLASVLFSVGASAVCFALVPLLGRKFPLACSLLGQGDRSPSVLQLLVYTILRVTSLVG